MQSVCDRFQHPKRVDSVTLCSCTVVVLCANANSIREIMISAAQNNFDNGDYVFINIDLFSR